jgi:hypothetical protein
MLKAYLFSALAFAALISPITASPVSPEMISRDESLGLNVDNGVDIVADWNVEENQSPNPDISPLERRDPKHFTFFRSRFYTQSCGPIGHNCNEGSNDIIKIHTDCNGGGCNGDIWRTWEYKDNACNKEFKVCGTQYVMKYTGKNRSCMSFQYFSTKNAYHGTEYANLMKSGKKVGTCRIYTSDFKARSCSIFGSSDFWSMIRCTFN